MIRAFFYSLFLFCLLSPAPALTHPNDLLLFILAHNNSGRNDSLGMKLSLRSHSESQPQTPDAIPQFMTRAVELFGSSLDMVAEYVFSLLETARKNLPNELSGFDKTDEGGHQQKVRGVRGLT